MSPTRRTVLAALVIVGGVLTPATAGDVRTRYLTITGSRTASATIEIAQRTWIDFQRGTVLRVGRYGGAAFGPYNEGYLYSTDEIPLTAGDNGVISSGGPYIEAGTYHVYLISDGSPVTVQIPWGGPGIRVEPTVPTADARVRVAHRTARDAVPRAVFTDVGGGPDTYVTGQAWWNTTNPTSRRMRLEVCVTPLRSRCDYRRGLAMPMIGEEATTLNSLIVSAGMPAHAYSKSWHVIGGVYEGFAPLDDLTVVVVTLPLSPGSR